MDFYSEQLYNAFFDEMGEIEKRAMLEVVASGKVKEAGFAARLGAGLKQFGEHGLKGAGTAMGKGYTDAITDFAAKNPDVGRLGKFWQGIKGMARTNEGTALGTGALALGGTAALGAGGGYLAGRSSAAPNAGYVV